MLQALRILPLLRRPFYILTATVLHQLQTLKILAHPLLAIHRQRGLFQECLALANNHFLS